MSKELLLSKAAEILDYVGETVKKTGEFVAEQAPDIAVQYITYARATSTTIMALATVVLIVAAIWGYFTLTRSDNEAGILALFPIGGAIAAIAVNWTTFFMSWFAPKVFLITEIVKLVK